MDYLAGPFIAQALTPHTILDVVVVDEIQILVEWSLLSAISICRLGLVQFEILHDSFKLECGGRNGVSSVSHGSAVRQSIGAGARSYGVQGRFRDTRLWRRLREVVD